MTQGFSIPAATVASLFAAAVLTTLLPLAVVILLGIRKKLSVMPFFVGMLGFFVSQMLLRIPLLSFLSTLPWYLRFASNPFVSALLIGGLSAGLFEETARLLCARIFCKSRLEWGDALSFGLGHGLCEVVLLVGISYVSSFFIAVLLNMGAVGLLEGFAPGMTEAVTGQFASVTPAMLALGVGERVPAMMFHIFASAIVFLGVRRGQTGWYFLAVLLHTVLNGAAALLALYTNVWVSEGFLWACGVLFLFLLPRVRKKYGGPAV